jgi:hypothetical protein
VLEVLNVLKVLEVRQRGCDVSLTGGHGQEQTNAKMQTQMACGIWNSEFARCYPAPAVCRSLNAHRRSAAAASRAAALGVTRLLSEK